MNIVSIIPARGGSKSIPRKNIVPVCGTPLIGWSIKQSLKTQLINHTFVTTNDDEIAEVSEKYGAKIIRRPESISGDFASSEDALLHALDVIENEYKITPDFVVFLQATSPLRKSDDIKKCIEQIITEGNDSIFSGCKLEDFLIWENEESRWKSFNYDYRNRGIRQQRKPQFVENGSIYIFKPSIIREYKNRLGGKISFFEMEFWQTWEIDEPEDIELVGFFLKAKIKNTGQ
jgi:CMP-N,N'-diacetyllegionaminic acid synthase